MYERVRIEISGSFFHYFHDRSFDQFYFTLYSQYRTHSEQSVNKVRLFKQKRE